MRTAKKTQIVYMISDPNTSDAFRKMLQQIILEKLEGLAESEWT